MKLTLYVWNWIGGGYNQTYAANREHALNQAKQIWSRGEVDMTTFRALNESEEKEYWKNFGRFD